MSIKIGLIGVGFMGKMHLSIHAKNPDVEIVALCDINPDLNDSDYLTKGGGNIELGDLGGFDYDAAAKYSSFDEFIKHDGIDVVDVCLPTYLHCEYTVKSFEAGKHVFCEKPIALAVEDADKMIDASEKAGKGLFVGHCIRFWPEYAWLKKAIDEKMYGEVKSATFRRVSPMPIWAWDNWLTDEARSGAAALDLHIHDTDFIYYLFGEPGDLFSQGASVLTDGMDMINTQYIYDDGPIVSAIGCWGSPGTYPFEMAFTVLCEKATIEFSTSHDPMLAVHKTDGSIERPEVESGDGYSLEIAYFISCIKDGKKPVVVTPQDAKSSLAIVLKEIENARK
jgi:predicted dehydrogenase